MSAQGRDGNEANRKPFDFYPTDPRYVRAVLRAIESGGRFGEAQVSYTNWRGKTSIVTRKAYACPCDVCRAGKLAPLPRGVWCDPCAGDLSFVRGVSSFYEAEAPGKGPEDWITVDIRPDADADVIADFRAPHVARGADFYTTNPPFDSETGDMFDFVSGCIERAAPKGGGLFLLPFGFFTSVKARYDWCCEHKADIWPITPRPSFGLNKHGKKGTDAAHYVFARFGEGVTGAHHAAIDWRYA